jgi:hypothetical protein
MQIAGRLLPNVHSMRFCRSESEISLAARNICAVVVTKIVCLATLSLRVHQVMQDLLADQVVVRACAETSRTWSELCGEGGTAPKIPVASLSGDAMFANECIPADS